MQGMGRDEVSDVTYMAVSELIVFGLESQGVAEDGDDPAESQFLIVKLLRRIEIVLAFTEEHLHSVSHLVVALYVVDYGEVLKGRGANSIEDANLDQFVLDVDVDWMDALGQYALNDAHLRRLLSTRDLFGENALAFSEVRRGDGQPQVSLLVIDHIGLKTLPDVLLTNFDAVDLEFSLRDDSLEVVTELNNNPVEVDTRDKPNILLIFLYLLLGEKKILRCQDLLVIRDLDHLVP